MYWKPMFPSIGICQIYIFLTTSLNLAEIRWNIYRGWPWGLDPNYDIVGPYFPFMLMIFFPHIFFVGERGDFQNLDEYNKMFKTRQTFLVREQSLLNFQPFIFYLMFARFCAKSSKTFVKNTSKFITNISNTR